MFRASTATICRCAFVSTPYARHPKWESIPYDSTTASLFASSAFLSAAFTVLLRTAFTIQWNSSPSFSVRTRISSLAFPPSIGRSWTIATESPASAAAIAAHTPAAAAGALRRPLGGDLAFIQMGPSGARALFQSDTISGGTIVVRMTPKGLELSGSVRLSDAHRPALPPAAMSFPGIPTSAPLFGATSTPGDLGSADIFAMLDPSIASFIRKSIVFTRAPGVNYYSLNASADVPGGGPPRVRLMKVLPEANKPGLSNVMFCSPTTVLRLYLPKVADTLMPLESAKMRTAARMLKRVRGDGLGFMSWRVGQDDLFFIRISRDELRGTSSLWSMLFID